MVRQGASTQQVSEGDLLELEDMLAFKGERGEAQEAAVMAAGFDQGEVFEVMDELAGRELQTLLTQLAFEQAVSQEGQHVEEEHAGDALILVQVDRGDSACYMDG